MRKFSLVTVLMSFLLAFAAAAQAEVTFKWGTLRSSPRSASPIQTAEQAKTWLLGVGKGDLALVTSKEEAGKTAVLLEQGGARALRTIRVKPHNQVSEDGGQTWQTGEFKNIVFGPAGWPVVFKGPLSIEWTNSPGGTAYYPVGLDSEWVPVLQGACSNLYLWHRRQPPAPPAKGPPPLVVQITVPPAPPSLPPPIALLPPPDYSGRAYHKPDRVVETHSVHTVATVGQIPIPKQEIRISNAGNNTNSASARANARAGANANASANNAGNTNINNNTNTNTNNNVNQQNQQVLNDLLLNIINNNTNVNTNTNAVNAIMQQLQQMVVPVGIGSGG